MPLDPLDLSFVDAELCVKCGLCLPHCPTYGKTLDENESPRGRLSLIQAWAADKLEATPKLLNHVDNCLLCRSCESACPANVPYGRLVDDFRAATSGKLFKSLTVKVKSTTVHYTLQSPRLQRWSGPARGMLSKSGLMHLTGFGELAAGLPKPIQHDTWQGFHPALGKENARVALFIGCTAELADAATVTSAIHLLTKLGIGVIVPEHQACCGGMALHAGDTASVDRLRKRNLLGINPDEVDAILSLASGCGAVLREYPDANGFTAKIKDISFFLAGHSWPINSQLESLSAKVFVHSPCSLKNVLKSDLHPPALLRRIPGVQVELPSKTVNCCGAAGTYLLHHPAMAHTLRDDILDQIVACSPNFVATSNVGCAMHLRAGLKQRGMERMEVLHPLVLLERQLRTE